MKDEEVEEVVIIDLDEVESADFLTLDEHSVILRKWKIILALGIATH